MLCQALQNQDGGQPRARLFEHRRTWMNRFRILIAVGTIVLSSMAIASAQSKTTKTTVKPAMTKAQIKADNTIPTWLVGKYKGYSSYMKASFDVSISANGLVFGSTQIGDKKMYHVDGRYHHNELIIGEKIYGINRRSDGVDLVNLGNSKDVVNLTKNG
jgi:hypothetical protein